MPARGFQLLSSSLRLDYISRALFWLFALVCIAGEQFFDLPSHGNDLSVFNHLLRQLIQELFFGHRLEIFIGPYCSNFLVLFLLNVGLLDMVNDLKKHSVRVFSFKDEGKIAIEKVCENFK